MRFTRFSAFLTLFSVLLAPALPAHAQCELQVHAGSGPGFEVHALLRTNTGELIVAGVTTG